MHHTDSGGMGGPPRGRRLRNPRKNSVVYFLLNGTRDNEKKKKDPQPGLFQGGQDKQHCEKNKKNHG